MPKILITDESKRSWSKPKKTTGNVGKKQHLANKTAKCANTNDRT